MFWSQVALLSPLQQTLIITSRTIGWIGTYLWPSESSPCSHSSTPMPTQTRTKSCLSSASSGIRLRSAPRTVSSTEAGPDSIPDDARKPPPHRSGFTNSWRLGSTSRSPSLHPISQTTTPHTRHHQLKTPRLGDDRLAYLGSPGAKHLGLYQPQVGGDCRTRTKMSFKPSSVRRFRTISDDPARLVRGDDAADSPQGCETSILRPSTARA